MPAVVSRSGVASPASSELFSVDKIPVLAAGLR